MAQFEKSTFRGLLVPDDRIKESNLDASNSTYTQADPLPGIPVPQGETDLNLEATGTQEANKQLRVAVQRGGAPGRGGMTVRWKEEGDSATSWRGAWPANAMTSDKVIRNVNPVATTGNREAIDPHAVLMDDNKIGVVYDKLYFALGTSYYKISFFTVSEDGTVSSDVDLYTRLVTTQRLHPCIMKLPDGTLHIYAYLEDIVADTVQVQCFESTDNGANWSLASDACLDEAIGVDSGASDYDLNDRPSAKMRVAYSGGQVLMLISMRSNDTSTGDFENGFFQYASSDMGYNFEKIEVWDRTINGTQAEIVPSANGFEVFYCSYLTSGTAQQRVRRKSLASAYIPLSSATEMSGPSILNLGFFDPCNGSGRSFTDAECTAFMGDDGMLYVMARTKQSGGTYASSNCGDLIMCVDRSGGASKDLTYELMGVSTLGAGTVGKSGGPIFFAEAGADFPKYFAAVAAHGRVYLFHNMQASTGTDDNSLFMMTLGGYQTVTLGSTQDSGALTKLVGWDHTYLPMEKPDDFAGWTASTSGTTSADVDSGYLNLSTGGGKLVYYKTPPGTPAEGIIAHFGVQFVSYSLGTELIFARFTLADGSDKCTLDVWIKNGSIAVEDNNGGTALGSLTIDTATNGVEVLVFFRDGKATVYAKEMTQAADLPWSAVCSNATVSDSGTGSMEVRFGHKVGSNAASRWYWFNYTSDEYAGGTPYSTGFTNPDDLQGKPISSQVSTYVNGPEIRAIDGPGRPGDTFNIDTRYGYGIENILVPTEPSPSKGWRSTNENANTIAWAFEGANQYRTLGLYLDGCNWRTATLEGYNALTSSWVSLASIDTATGQTALEYNRIGNTIGVNTSASTTAGRYFERDEFVGGTVDLGSSKYRTISSNSPGVWTNAAGHVLPGVEFDGLDNSEPASGQAAIWSPRILVIIHNTGTIYTKFKLAIAAQSTATDDIRIGQLVMGGVELFSHDYSFGRTISTEANTELVTYRDGSRSSLKRGDSRRSVTFGWGEGVDITPLQGSTPAPDYLVGTTTGGASPVNYRGDVPTTLQRLDVVTAGPGTPVVYIPRIDRGSSGNDVKTIQGLGPVYGRIVSGVATDALLGEENDAVAGEVLRIQTIQIEEEL